MDKKQEYILIGVGVLVVILVVVGLIIQQNKGGFNTAQKTTSQGYLTDNPNALPTVQGGTREKVMTNVPTPSANATGTPKNVAVPTVSNQTGAITFRHFEITGSGNQFVPSTIVVNNGDIIDLKLSASDQSYNMFFPDFGVNITAPKGSTASAQFQATNYGQYQFVCSICSGKVTGTLIVNQKQ